LWQAGVEKGRKGGGKAQDKQRCRGVRKHKNREGLVKGKR